MACLLKSRRAGLELRVSSVSGAVNLLRVLVFASCVLVCGSGCGFGSGGDPLPPSGSGGSVEELAEAGSVVRSTYDAIHFGRVDNIEYFVCDRQAHSAVATSRLLPGAGALVEHVVSVRIDGNFASASARLRPTGDAMPSRTVTVALEKQNGDWKACPR